MPPKPPAPTVTLLDEEEEDLTGIPENGDGADSTGQPVKKKKRNRRVSRDDLQRRYFYRPPEEKGGPGDGESLRGAKSYILSNHPVHSQQSKLSVLRLLSEQVSWISLNLQSWSHF